MFRETSWKFSRIQYFMRDILRLSLPLHTCPVCLVPARQFEAQQLSNSFALLHPHLAPSFSHLPPFFASNFFSPFIFAPLWHVSNTFAILNPTSSLPVEPLFQCSSEMFFNSFLTSARANARMPLCYWRMPLWQVSNTWAFHFISRRQHISRPFFTQRSFAAQFLTRRHIGLNFWTYSPFTT